LHRFFAPKKEGAEGNDFVFLILFCKKEEMYQKCNHVDTHGRVYPKILIINYLILFCKKEEMYQKCNHVDTHGRVYPKRLSII
jgi:hypothetical protein